MRLCVKCKHHKPLSGGHDICQHDKAFVDQNPVTGRKSWRDCSLMREYETLCGKEAKLFEEKKSWIERIMGK